MFKKTLKAIYLFIRTRDRDLFAFLLIFNCILKRKKAIVINRIEAMGDVICTLPMCIEIKHAYPNHLIVFITGNDLSDLVRMSGVCDVVYGAAQGNFTVKQGFLKLVDKVYSPHTSDELGDSGSQKHLVENLASSCGILSANIQPRIIVSQQQFEIGLRKYGISKPYKSSRKLICINTGPAWPVRNWSDNKWQLIADYIHKNYEADIIETGSPQNIFGDIHRQIKGTKLIIGMGKPRDFAALLSACDLLISIDSGPIHLAGAVGIPVIGLYGALNPKYFLPREGRAIGLITNVPCLFCHHESPIGHWKSGCPHDIRCMKELGVESVYRAIKELLGEPTPISSDINL